MTIALGQTVLKTVHNSTKLRVRTTDIFNIERIHVNGTINMQLRPGVQDHVNIRQGIPYCLNNT